MRHSIGRLVVMANMVACIAVCGCGQAADVTEDEVFTVTRLGFQDDGTVIEESWQVLRSDQLLDHKADEEERARAAAGLGQAEQAISWRITGCLTSDFRMWSSNNYTGNNLCFYGTSGIRNLANHLFPGGGSWADDIRSIKTAAHTGDFNETEVFPCCGGVCHQGPSEDDPDTDSCVDTANWFAFDGECNESC